MSTQSRRLAALFSAVVTLTGACAPHTQETRMTTTHSTSTTTSSPVRNGYVAANGVRYYYEVHGKGESLLLLHGGLGSIELFEPSLPELAARREVIAVELHGHGRTQLGNRKISLLDQGDDMATIVEALGYKQVDAMGYSLGGGVALRLAIQHPERVRRLVVVSAGFAQSGFYPEMLPMQAQLGAAMADVMKETPIYKSYAAIAPDPAEFPVLLDRLGENFRQPYDWSEDVKTLKVPVMLVCGDSDMFRLEHIVEFYHLLGGGLKDAGWQREHMSRNRLAILPNTTHYEMSSSPQLVPTALSFLDGNTDTPSQ